MNEVTPRILEGLANLIYPDIVDVTGQLRDRATTKEGEIRKNAPAAIAKAAEWILENSGNICEILEARAGNLPMSRAMMEEAFKNCVTRWTDSDKLRKFIREETLKINAGHAQFPEVVFHNLAGNLFVSGWESITHATLIGASSIVRCSEIDTIFPAIWAHAISLADSNFKNLIAVCEWSHQDSKRFEDAISNSDAVVIYGSDEAVQNLRNMTSWTKPFAGHGSTLSFSLLTADDLRNNPVEWLAEGCAYDFSVYDQQGCLSPRALFVEDLYSRDVDRFIESLHDSLLLIDKKIPRVKLSLDESAALSRARDTVLLDAACGGAGRRASGNHDPFLLTVKPVTHFQLGPVNRYVDVYLYKQLAEVSTILIPVKGRISTLGIADPRKIPDVLASSLQVKRICEFGKMQIPPLAWALDGYRPLQKMMRFQTIQTS